MEKKAEIYVGAMHHFIFRGNTVESGVILEDMKDRFLCQITGTDMFYHIKKDGNILVYCDTEHQEDELPSVKTELREGVFFLDVNLLAEISFLFMGKPLSSDQSFLVSDMYVARDFLLNRATNTATRYQSGIDKAIDAKLRLIRNAKKQ